MKKQNKDIKIKLMNLARGEDRQLMPRPAVFKSKVHPSSKARRAEGKRVLRSFAYSPYFMK